MIKVSYIENAGPLEAESTNAIIDLLGEKERVKYVNYRRWQDKQAYLLGKLLVMQELNLRGYSFSLIKQLKYTNFDRPYIKEAAFDFNISHSGTLVICAASEDQTVGIDLELIQNIDLSDFSYILNERDVADITSSDDKYKTFFKIWSAKEAVLKADGCGLTDNLHQLEIFSGKGFLMDKVYYLKELDIDKNYSTCVASSTPLTNIIVGQVFLSDCLQILK